MRASMPPKYEVREVIKVIEKAVLESKMTIYDSGRMIMEESHLTLQDEVNCSTRNYLAPYVLAEFELQREGRQLDATGTLYVSLAEY